jgi:hypothetical protein
MRNASVKWSLLSAVCISTALLSACATMTEQNAAGETAPTVDAAAPESTGNAAPAAPAETAMATESAATTASTTEATAAAPAAEPSPAPAATPASATPDPVASATAPPPPSAPAPAPAKAANVEKNIDASLITSLMTKNPRTLWHGATGSYSFFVGNVVLADYQPSAGKLAVATGNRSDNMTCEYNLEGRLLKVDGAKASPEKQTPCHELASSLVTYLKSE